MGKQFANEFIFGVNRKLIKEDYNEKNMVFSYFFERWSAFLTSKPGGESWNRLLDTGPFRPTARDKESGCVWQL